MTTLTEICAVMAEYNGSVSPGSGGIAWQDFVDASYDEYGVAPWTSDVQVDDEFSQYWLAVANGSCADYANEQH